MKIDYIFARQILDSRGNPTIEVEAHYKSFKTIASVPSGASTGKHEACELRDFDASIYGGKSVFKAVNYVNNEVSALLKTLDFTNQALIDYEMIKLDGTENKSRLGANTLLACSLAIAKLTAKVMNQPFYQYINSFLPGVAPKMPTPFINILNGGMHADNNLDIQEFMIVPTKPTSFSEQMRMSVEVFHCLKSLLKSNKLNVNVGDEGGFAPQLTNTKETIYYLIEAIELAGYQIGQDFSLALDVAASSFFENEKYSLEGNKIDSNKMVEFLVKLTEDYPIISIEDALAEEDYSAWSSLTQKIGNKIQLIGDDLFVTNPKLLQNGIDAGLANSILIKPNQIGTLSETIETIRIARQNNYKYMISHRSGETEDTSIAHIAVGTGAGQIKTGSVCRGERVAKYNELLRIEEILLLK